MRLCGTCASSDRMSWSLTSSCVTGAPFMIIRALVFRSSLLRLLDFLLVPDVFLRISSPTVFSTFHGLLQRAWICRATSTSQVATRQKRGMVASASILFLASTRSRGPSARVSPTHFRLRPCISG
eukprot:m.262270 g.262270  ORF g.262270 m.262270 type:complete len:125 (-) comp54619_c1_seq7:447-821(-)